MGITFSYGVRSFFRKYKWLPLCQRRNRRRKRKRRRRTREKTEEDTEKMEENIFFLFFSYFFLFLISHKSKLKAYFMPNLTMFHSSFMVTFNVRHQFQFGPSMSCASTVSSFLEFCFWAQLRFKLFRSLLCGIVRATLATCVIAVESTDELQHHHRVQFKNYLKRVIAVQFHMHNNIYQIFWLNLWILTRLHSFRHPSLVRTYR